MDKKTSQKLPSGHHKPALQNKKEAEHEVALIVANNESFLNANKTGKGAVGLITGNKELVLQNKKITKQNLELLTSNKELVMQGREKETTSAKLIVANKKLIAKNKGQEEQSTKLLATTKQLAFVNQEKDKRTDELIIANQKLAFQDKEKEDRADELIASTAEHVNVRRKNEEYIRHLAAIVESSDDTIISKSLDGIIESWNIGGEKMFGYTANEAIGKNISLIIPSEYMDEEKKLVQKICKNEIVDRSETIRIKKNGERLNVAITTSPLKDLNGKIIGITKIVRDITLSKNYEQELLKANELLVIQNIEKENRTAELEAVNLELESFSYSVSHDLRAPLRAINGFAQVMVEDYMEQLDSDAKTALNEIMSNAITMGQLIDNLLDFSRIGKQALNRVITNIAELVDNVIEDLEREEPVRILKITINALKNIMGDRNMLKQVFINLIANAFKYTRNKKEAIIEIGSYTEDGNCVYYVKDNGVGFDMLYYDKLFGVFQRLHSNNEFEGTGVGLAIIQKIVTKHGGKVWAEAKVNEGACFYISLPDTL